MPDASHYFGPLVQTIAVVTLIYSSLATIIQQDTKSLIAYSSIAHMSVVILGLSSRKTIEATSLRIVALESLYANSLNAYTSSF